MGNIVLISRRARRSVVVDVVVHVPMTTQEKINECRNHVARLMVRLVRLENLTPGTVPTINHRHRPEPQAWILTVHVDDPASVAHLVEESGLAHLTTVEVIA